MLAKRQDFLPEMAKLPGLDSLASVCIGHALRGIDNLDCQIRGTHLLVEWVLFLSFLPLLLPSPLPSRLIISHLRPR
jgi:hypothetical protein